MIDTDYRMTVKINLQTNYLTHVYLFCLDFLIFRMDDLFALSTQVSKLSSVKKV